MATSSLMSATTTFGRIPGVACWGDASDGLPATAPNWNLAAHSRRNWNSRNRQTQITRPAKGGRRFEISAVLDAVTLGTLLGMLVRQQDQRRDYSDMAGGLKPPLMPMARYQTKYGIKARAAADGPSARERSPGGPRGDRQATASPHTMERSDCWVNGITRLKAAIDPPW